MKNRTTTRLLVLAAGIATVGIILGGALFYRFQEGTLRRSVESQLESIAEVKASQVRLWREERIHEVYAISEVSYFRTATKRILEGGQPGPAAQEQIRTFMQIFGYKDVSFINIPGRTHYSLDGTKAELPPEIRPYYDEALHSEQPVMTDLHRDPLDGKPHVDVLAAIGGDTSRDRIGVLMLTMEASQSLYPLLQSWPVPTRSAETLMLRREGDSLLFLNDGTSRKNIALNVRVPITQTNYPVVAAVMGQKGILSRKDYRNVLVLTASRQIPGTTWWMVTKVDATEAMAAWHGFSRLILGTILGLAATTVALAGLLAQRRRRAHLELQLQVESALAREREQFAVTLRSIGDGVITSDIQERVVLMNRVAEQLTGWTQAEAAGRSFSEVFRIAHEYTGEPCENPVRKVLRTGSIVELANHTVLITKDGRTCAIADSAAPIRDHMSTITGVVLVFRDVSEKQRMEESLTRSQKLDALGVLAGGIAHDFNNLLSGIFGFLDLGREQIRQNQGDKALKSIDKAMGVFERTKGLTRQLLTFAKGGAPQRRPQRLQTILEESVHFSLTGSAITCEFDISEDLSPCEIDESQIAQVVSNLALNAKEAMPEGGCLRITARNVLLRQGDCPPLPSGAFVEVAFQDQGVGIQPNIFPLIFDPFFSTKERGSGLGLAMAHSILGKHDGTITVESVPGQGSTFRIFLPATQRTLLPEPKPVEAVPHESGRILLMDDEPFVRQIASETLESLGYKMTLARDGSEAIEIFSKARGKNDPYALVILDLTVPGGMGGLETAKHLKGLDPEVRLIVSSGYSNDPVMSDPGAHGFVARINKPYLRDELAQTVARCLA